MRITGDHCPLDACCSFGFWAGANVDPNAGYQPHITSYDYHAPLSEAGDYCQPGTGGDCKFEASLPQAPAAGLTAYTPPIHLPLAPCCAVALLCFRIHAHLGCGTPPPLSFWFPGGAAKGLRAPKVVGRPSFLCIADGSSGDCGTLWGGTPPSASPSRNSSLRRCSHVQLRGPARSAAQTGPCRHSHLLSPKHGGVWAAGRTDCVPHTCAGRRSSKRSGAGFEATSP